MAYDEELADRIRWLIGYDPALTERKMFGGLAFLIRGHMAITVSRQGGVLVHVDPARAEDLIATTGATEAEMRGRPMPGWLRVTSADLVSDDQLEGWIQLGTEYARSLPAKH
jgi:TfoX-like protein